MAGRAAATPVTSAAGGPGTINALAPVSTGRAVACAITGGCLSGWPKDDEPAARLAKGAGTRAAEAGRSSNPAGIPTDSR
eukprot:scaffold3767_cov114-Isochrysis_galbana.AAC.46